MNISAFLPPIFCAPSGPALPYQSFSPSLPHLPRHATCCSLPPIPFLPENSRGARGVRSLSYALILSQAAESLREQIQSLQPPVKLTVDFPPQASEQSAGTLVSRFENNLNFMEKLMEELGCSKWEPVGGTVQICDNINPQGGGEYLSDDECMVGIRGRCEEIGRDVMVLINAGVDGGTLRDVSGLAGESEVVVLVNCGLERLSWLDKIGFREYIEGFKVGYYLKMMGGGWLLGTGKEWGVTVNGEIIWKGAQRPKTGEVDRMIRLALSGLREKP